MRFESVGIAERDVTDQARLIFLAYGDVTMRMHLVRWMRVVTVALLCVVVAESALAASCLQVSWQANTEPDLAGYRLTLIPDGVAAPAIEVAAPLLQAPCQPLVPANYEVRLTAFDASGNESAPAVLVRDLKPPVSPTGVTITITVSVP